MAKDPAFLFYDGDAARDVSHMNRTERGCYFDLLQAQRKFHGFTMEQAKKILGKDFNDCWPALEMVLKLENGKFFIEWVRDSMEKRKVNAEKNRQRIQEYWDKKNNSNEVPKAFHGNSNELPYVIENENAIENENEIINKEEINFKILETQEEMREVDIYPTFDDFWNEYDKKVGKEKAKTKWKALSQKDKEAIMDYIPNYKAAQPEKQFRKDPETFFSKKAWNDEIIDNGKQQTSKGTGNGTTDRTARAAELYQKYGGKLSEQGPGPV
jgi:hypothetical protein